MPGLLNDPTSGLLAINQNALFDDPNLWSALNTMYLPQLSPAMAAGGPGSQPSAVAPRPPVGPSYMPPPHVGGGGAEGVLEAQAGLPQNKVSARDYFSTVGFPGLLTPFMMIAQQAMTGQDPIQATIEERLREEVAEQRAGGGDFTVASKTGYRSRGVEALEGPEAAAGPGGPDK